MGGRPQERDLEQGGRVDTGRAAEAFLPGTKEGASAVL